MCVVCFLLAAVDTVATHWTWAPQHGTRPTLDPSTGSRSGKASSHSLWFFVLCALKSMVTTIPNFLFLFDLDLDAAGALLLRTVTGVTAAMYGSDHKLIGERLPLLPLVLFSTPIALLCWFRTLATGVVKAYWCRSSESFMVDHDCWTWEMYLLLCINYIAVLCNGTVYVLLFLG